MNVNDYVTPRKILTTKKRRAKEKTIQKAVKSRRKAVEFLAMAQNFDATAEDCEVDCSSEDENDTEVSFNDQNLGNLEKNGFI